MKRFWIAFIPGFFAPFVFILGAEPFEKSGYAVIEMTSACLAMGLYLVICLLFLMPKGAMMRDRIAGMAGMATPLGLTVALMVFVEKPQTVLQQGVPMLAAACIAILIGGWGADGLQFRLEQVGRLFIRPEMRRRILAVCAALFAVVAIVLAAAVIPAVKADPFPHAAPERAVPAFWVSIILHGFAVLRLTALAMRPPSNRRGASMAIRFAVLLAFLLGLALAAPGIAFRSHGPAMYAASALLILCGAADMIAAALLAAAAFASPISESAGSGKPTVSS